MDVIIEQLNKVYSGNVHALQDLTLTIPTGMFGLLGPNGAGKTTLMRTLAGILHPTSGRIQVGPYDGTSERGRLAIQRTLGYLPQEVGLYPDLNAREFLDYIGLLKGLDNDRERKQRVEELLTTVALQQVAQRKIKTYSGGMKRRVGIAQALLNNPRLLIVDEPTAGLDPEERIRFRNLLSDLAGERTILLSTHIVEDIAQTCQNIAMMQKGQVIFQGTIQQLLQQTRDKVWLLTTNGPRPSGNCTIVSTLHLSTGVQYRVVGTPGTDEQAVATEPSLEDGYVWFMQHQQSLAA
jgi:ABC-2 type transport system ATP-binding protein